jgi:hypothetical protein
MSRFWVALLSAVTIFLGVTVVAASARALVRRHQPTRTFATLAGATIYATLLAVRPEHWLLIDAGVLCGAIGGALLLERGLTTKEAVLVFLSVAAIVDILSFSGGLTRALVTAYHEGRSNVLQYLTLVVPMHDRVLPIVGIGDLL